MAVLLGDSLLRKRMEEKNIKVSELAVAMECSKQYLYALMRNEETPSLEFAINLSVILGCDVRDLQELIHVSSRKG